ncbi:transcription antitermination factor NusB [Candidatus Woesebacteria bacterium GWB1_43_5]|uniref:Transcription antitermination protein NusB n=1 Tax=Candidatus Woesebacteria bacterium GWB1_43_5 TaxID=1802474 RepID=A0A1F7WQX8_9BACT|nr:MAG: transcription antitermination factor NusB [Candidatus Woesebacteria bacterium GWB1_43_5]
MPALWILPIVKTKSDPRHLKRRQVVQQLFAESFASQAKLSGLTKKVIAKTKKIDGKIIKSAPQWPIDKLNKIDLAILRLAVYELLYETKTPSKVVIDEAIELAKEFGAESSPGFINGVLGSVYDREDAAKKT